MRRSTCRPIRPKPLIPMRYAMCIRSFLECRSPLPNWGRDSAADPSGGRGGNRNEPSILAEISEPLQRADVVPLEPSPPTGRAGKSVPLPPGGRGRGNRAVPPSGTNRERVPASLGLRSCSTEAKKNRRGGSSWQKKVGPPRRLPPYGGEERRETRKNEEKW